MTLLHFFCYLAIYSLSTHHLQFRIALCYPSLTSLKASIWAGLLAGCGCEVLERRALSNPPGLVTPSLSVPPCLPGNLSITFSVHKSECLLREHGELCDLHFNPSMASA
jgi:hypothetical protein